MSIEKPDIPFNITEEQDTTEPEFLLPDSSENTSRFIYDESALFARGLAMVKPCAYKIARIYGVFASSHEFEDIISDGYEGLVAAIKNYDQSKVGSNATTGTAYIGEYISNYMKHGLRERWGRAYAEKDAEGNVIKKERIARLKPSVILGTAKSINEESEDNKSPMEHILEVPIEQRLGETSSEKIGFDDELMRILKTYTSFDQEVFIRSFYGGQNHTEIAEAMSTYPVKISRALRKIHKNLFTQMNLTAPRKAA
jgi:RNA polymerase sigma factor (sigma-70 family)